MDRRALRIFPYAYNLNFSIVSLFFRLNAYAMNIFPPVSLTLDRKVY